MEQLRFSLAIGALLFSGLNVAHAQDRPDKASEQHPVQSATKQSPAATENPSSTQEQLESLKRDVDKLRRQLTAQGGPQPDEQKKRLELLQKQIETLQRMVDVLAEQMKKQAPAGTMAKLQLDTATLEARSQRGAIRDRELADAIDDLREEQDAARRKGAELPSALREHFLPSRTNQSPLAIFGTVAATHQDFQDRPGSFPTATFSPHFYLLLNESFLLEANAEFRGNEVALASGQLDWFLHDNLTLVVGRFYSPLGFFNERLHTSWIFKTPDRPLVFQQVLPLALSFDGGQARGAFQLGDLADAPIKLEYSALVANGFSLSSANPGPKDYADLRAMADVFNDVNQAKAVGGRLGLSLPGLGLIVGLSGLANGSYDRAGHDLDIWDVDASWHQGNWDLRFEYAQANQETPGSPIRRRGYYAQAAYRPYDCPQRWLQDFEAVVRYDYVDFDGINLAATGLNFGSREAIPINRRRYTLGLNYYPYPSLIFKVAYEVNDEFGFRELRDNGFLAQVSWGF